MKRIAIMLACLLVISLLAGPASAAIKGVRLYRAGTSDGQSMRFRVVRDERGRRLGGVIFGQDFQLPCDDGTTVSLSRGFRSPQWFFEGRTVTVDYWYEQDIIAMHIVGTFGPATASGTFRYTEALLNEDETTRLCSTGDLTWTAERIYPTPGTST